MIVSSELKPIKDKKPSTKKPKEKKFGSTLIGKTRKKMVTSKKKSATTSIPVYTMHHMIPKHGTENDHKKLLLVCQNFDSNNRLLLSISQKAMDWVYPYAKYAVDNGIKTDINEKIVNYYEMAYLNR